MSVRTQYRSVPVASAAEADDFHALMGEQLRRAPWLLLSVAVHGIAVLILLLLPGEPQRRVVAAFGFQPPPPPTVEQPPPPPPLPDIVEDQPVDDPVDDPVTQPSEHPDPAATFTENPKPAPSAFDHAGFNPTIGISGSCGGPGPYGDRGSRGSRGSPREKSLHAALKWLARHQDEDGRWDADGFMKHDREGTPCDGAGNPVHDVGVTGLALLAFLGDGSTLRGGEFRDQLRSGVRWLKDQQQDNGLFGQNASHDFVYGHAIAAYAMVEAYGLSQYTTLKHVAQGGIHYLESHRNPYGVWRYQPRDNDNDTSVTGWCIMAYESAKFFKLDVNENALKLSAVWLDQVATPDGRHGYSKAGEPSSRHPGDHGTRFPVEKGESMTAVGLFCRFFLGQNPKEVPVMKASADLILSKPPIWDTKAGTIDHYYWYYATYALYQMGGRHWQEWSRHLTPAVLRTQRQDGNFHGSWDPAGAWGQDGGRVYATAILALTLEAYHRYTRLIR